MDTEEQVPPTAIVTGGGSGIGAGIAVALAEGGTDVLIAGRREDALRRTAAHHERIRTHVADIADPAQAEAVVAAATEAFGRLDALVNNAAFGVPGPLGEIDVDSANAMWATNVIGPVALAQHALPALRASRGAIVNVSSTFGAKPAPGIGIYGATKAALEQLTRTWALELAPDGVRVNAVAPGPTESEALVAMGLTPEQIEEVTSAEAQQIPLGRRGTPEDVVPWVLALVRPGGYVTGQVIGVDGGYVIAGHLG